MPEKDQLKSALKKALSMEEDGYKVYSEGADKIKNSLGKRMLKRLAQDELNHINRIKEIYSYVTGESESLKVKEVQVTDFEDIFKRIKDQLKESIDELSEVGVDDQEIIDMGLELETHAKFFYTEQAGKTSDPKVKKFYEMMATEEQSHYDALRNTNKFLENPALFFGMGYH